MNTLTTNIIRNVYNIGTNSCDSGPQYCSDGYALYFPCLKEITKGQEACFDFYIADYAGKNAADIAAALASDNGTGDDGDNSNTNGSSGSGNELADLRDVDAITLNLLGAFNCPYGTFSYPDDITSLQTEEYPVVYRDDFGERKLCNLQVIKIDTDQSESEPYYTLQDDYYSGTEIEVGAYDTPTHIFEGWAILNDEDDDCPEDTLNDSIISTSNIYKFTIQEDLILLAVYRPRNVYSVVVDPTNRSSHFIVDYDHITYFISNREEIMFDDEYNIIENVLEGYHMFVKCIPSSDVMGNSEDGDDDTTYRFVEWSDHNKSRCRMFIVGDGTMTFGDQIKLKAVCDGPVPLYHLVDENQVYMDNFDEEGIHIYTEPSDVDIYDYYGNDKTIYVNEVYQKFIEETGYLYFNNGTLILSSASIENGIKVILHARSEGEEPCELNITINGVTATQELSVEEFKQYEFYFSKCNKSSIEISVNGECLIDMIEVCKEEIIDKGKARLCIPPEVTANLPSGPLSVNGAIMVNGRSYGLATTSIGSVNKLPTITITT